MIIFVYFSRVVNWENNNNDNNNNKTRYLIFMVFGKALLKICYLKPKMVTDTKINIAFKKE